MAANALPELLREVRRRPGMYVAELRFYTVAAYLQGYFAPEVDLVPGFKEWLVVKNDGGNELLWSAVVMQLVVKGRSGSAVVTASDHESAIDSMFLLLEEFLQYRVGVGTRRVFLEYQAWLEKQPWYRVGSSSYLPR